MGVEAEDRNRNRNALFLNTAHNIEKKNIVTDTGYFAQV